ncbi:hypothetical protein ES703_101274 [subsurface metagenome]
MKLEKAIEIGKELLTDLPPFTFEQRREAVKMLIQAGEAFETLRSQQIYPSSYLLPGEIEK